MAAVSSVQSSASPSLQQFKLQQARRAASEAEQYARALEQQTAQAQQTLQNAQEQASSLSNRSAQAQSQAGRARQSLVAETGRVSPTRAASLAENVSGILPTTAAKPSSTPSLPAVASSAWASRLQPTVAAAAPVLNTQGQVTGTLLNVTA